MDGTNTLSREVLLGCGAASGVLYFLGDAFMSARYPGYNPLHRTVSELKALGAPTREISIACGLAGYALLLPFGVGVWRSAAGSRGLRVAGGLPAGLGAFGLWGVPFASMQPPGEKQEGLHALSGLVGLLLVAAMGGTATAPAGHLRLYSLATIAAMVAFSGWAAMQAGGVEVGQATAWIGAKERVGFYSWHLWFIALALQLLRQDPAARVDSGDGGGRAAMNSAGPASRRPASGGRAVSLPPGLPSATSPGAEVSTGRSSHHTTSPSGLCR